MKAARIRLIVAVSAFVVWLGYLGFLALGHAKPVIVSRSQLLIATVLVKAEADPLAQDPRIVRVLQSFGAQPVTEETIIVENFAAARLPGGKPLRAAGTYLLPLERIGPQQFRVAAAPSGQGYEVQSRQVLVYPWNADVERQIRELVPKAP